MNKESLESYYSSLSISRMDYFANFKNASAFLKLQKFKKLRGGTNRSAFFKHEKKELANYKNDYLPYNLRIC